jgi:hypothetical protein
MKLRRIQLPTLLTALLLTPAACGIQEIVDSERLYPLDGVKLVKADIDSPSDPSTTQQPEYALDPSARLLLRFESLGTYANEIRTESGHAIEVLVNPRVSNHEELETVRSKLQLCSLARNWMMLATWKRGHPFDASGKWAKPGGDYDSEQCFQPTITEKEELAFDVTPWLIQEVRGRGRNYGFVLLSTSSLRISGDASGAQSPRIRWVRSTGIIHPRKD